MNRRNMIKGGFVGLLSTSTLFLKKTDAKSKHLEEERTRQYLDNILEWDERRILLNVDDAQHREFLFVGGYDRKELLDCAGEVGYALVYSPRHIVQKGHFFDLIRVKIGDRNITRIQELFKEEDHKDRAGNFIRLSDI